MKNSVFSVMAFAFFLSPLFTSNAQAEQIENLKIVPTTSELSIQWDLLPEEDSIATDGYALQWSDILSNIKIDQSPRQTVSKSRNYLAVRAAGFERDKKYYFRVYSYIKDDRNRGYDLFNGSKILEWMWKANGEVETNYIEANDPVINSVEDSVVFNFGQIRVIPFDQSVQLSWSRANLANHEYDGFVIALSEKADLSDPVFELKSGKSIFKGFIEGLTPEKKYYVGGYFYKRKNGVVKKFGRGTIVPFTTSEKFTTSQLQSYQRTITRLKRSGLGATGKIGNESDTNTTTTVNKTSSSSLSDKSEIEKRIKELENEIREKQKELSTLKRKLRSIFGKTTTQKNTRRTSLRERLLKRLNR